MIRDLFDQSIRQLQSFNYCFFFLIHLQHKSVTVLTPPSQPAATVKDMLCPDLVSVGVLNTEFTGIVNRVSQSAGVKTSSGEVI